MIQETSVTLEIAASKDLESFIKVLYAAAATMASDQVNKNLASAIGGWANPARNTEKKLGVDLIQNLVNLVKTGNVDSDELVAPIRKLRQAISKALKADHKVEIEKLEILQALSTYMLTQSELAFKRAVKLLPHIGEEVLTDSFIFEAKTQKEFEKPLSKIVKAFTKQEGISLTAEQVKALREKNPAVHKEYLRLRREYNQVWQDELRNFVFESGKKAVNFEAAVKFLDSKGITHTLPSGFKGLVDSNGAIYTRTGKAIVGLPGPGFSIRMNPEYDANEDNTYVFTTINDATGKVSQHVYTAAYKRKATDEKFQKVQELDKTIDAIRGKWLRLLKQGGTSEDVVAATALEIIYMFSARVGTIGNEADGKPTYGISTLEVRHVKDTGTSIILAYPGKKGIRQVHKLDPASPDAKFVIRNLRELIEGKGPKERLFTYTRGTNGRHIDMPGTLLNNKFKRMGSPVGVHKMRHLRGTRLFNELLKANEDKIFNRKKPLTEAQAMSLFKQLATKVGQMLGHVRGVGSQQKVTPATAIANYIDRGVMVGYFQRLGMRPPKALLNKEKEM